MKTIAKNMIQGFCHHCQTFSENEFDFCLTCREQLEIINANYSASAAPNDSFETQIPGNPTEQSDYTNSATAAHPFDNATSFGAQGSAYRDGYRNNAAAAGGKFAGNAAPHYSSMFAESNFSTVAKQAIIAVAFLVGLGFICTNTKAFFSEMPERALQRAAENQNQPRTSVKQEPWFSSWFRSEPTAEEIFDKFEEVTLTGGKSLNSNGVSLKGKIKFALPNSDIEKTYRDLSVQTFSQSFSTGNFGVTGIADLDIDFEMQMKTPDKALIKMEMTPRDLRLKQNKVVVQSGSDGTNNWTIADTRINGSTETKENTQPTGSVFGKKEDFLNPTFTRESYQGVKLISTEVVAGKQTYFVKAVKPDGEMESLYFDIETGLVNKTVGRYGEAYIVKYGIIGEIIMPTVLLQKVENEIMLISIDDYQNDVSLDDSIFSRSSY